MASIGEAEVRSPDDNFDDWVEDSEEQVKCLFCNSQHDGVASTLAHMISSHGFNLNEVRSQLGLDMYGSIRLINYVRSSMQAKDASVESIKATLSGEGATALFSDEKYLIPALPDDGLLFGLDDSDDDEDDQEEKASSASSSKPKKAKTPAEYEREISELKNQVAELRSAMASMAQTFKRLALEEKIQEQTPSPNASSDASADSKTDDNTGYKRPCIAPPIDTSGAVRFVSTDALDKKDPNKQRNDDAYFGGYSTRRIHEIMLKDYVRTECYRDAMYDNKELFEGKVVLDVGCGTGILSMFAAKAGAKKVIGIDRAGIIDRAKEIVHNNGLDHIVTLIKDTVETVTLPVEKVDIIISEWMGYFLLFESMLPSVLFARDKWLVEGGMVYPDYAMMYISAAEASYNKSRTVGFWHNVYGFDMSILIDDRERWTGSDIEIVDPKRIITDTQEIASFDLMTVRPEELDYTSKFQLEITRDDNLECFVVHFDTPFTRKLKNPKLLRTGAEHPPTHWKQSTFYLANPIACKKGDVVKGELRASRTNENEREYDVMIRYSVVHKSSGEDVETQAYIQEYQLTGWSDLDLENII